MITEMSWTAAAPVGGPSGRYWQPVTAQSRMKRPGPSPQCHGHRSSAPDWAQGGIQDPLPVPPPAIGSQSCALAAAGAVDARRGSRPARQVGPDPGTGALVSQGLVTVIGRPALQHR